jgi:hypothetical protein
MEMVFLCLLLAHLDGKQLAGILIDTHNLTSGSPRDKRQATILLVGAGSLGRNGFYNQCKFLDPVVYWLALVRTKGNIKYSFKNMSKLVEVSLAR